MAITVKNLYEGQLPLATAPLYPCPAGKAAIVKSIRLTNRTAAAKTANIWYLRNGGTGNRLLTPASVSLPVGSLFVDDSEITMAAGDQILGDASAVTSVDIVISGIERDA